MARAQNYLEPEYAQQIYKWYTDYQDFENHAKLPTLKT